MNLKLHEVKNNFIASNVPNIVFYVLEFTLSLFYIHLYLFPLILYLIIGYIVVLLGFSMKWPKHTGELWVYIGTPLPNSTGNTGVTVCNVLCK